MGRRALALLLITTLILYLLVSHFSGRRGGGSEEAARLRFDNAHLREKITALEAQFAVKQQTQAVDAAARTTATPDPGSTSSLAAQLLDLHAHWDWKAIAKDMMQPFAGIDEAMLENGVRTCYENGTMYCMRAQVRDNRLYIQDYRAVFFDRHYAPARIMPLLDVLRRHKIPDVDIVVAAVDEPRVKTIVDAREWSRTIQRFPGGLTCSGGSYSVHGQRFALPAAGPAKDIGQLRGSSSGPFRRGAGSGDASLPPPLFSSTVNRGHLDLAWPDFSFYMPRRPHKLRTPPWSKLHPQMLRESATLDWKDKIPLAVHTGNVGSPFRKRLAEEAKRSPGEMLVNELFIGDHGKITSTCAQLNLHKTGGFQQHKCYMTFTEQCSYKYLLNSASIGYANKFKYLLLCGSVVIYVRDGMQHKEFYEYGLLPGVHYVAVDKAADVPSMVRWLKENDAYARAVALAGRARMASLSVDGVADFMAELLTQYAAKQTFRPQPHPGAVEIRCEDDLWRHYARDPQWMAHYLMEDNSTCITPPPPGGLRAPGWGGSCMRAEA